MLDRSEPVRAPALLLDEVADRQFVGIAEIDRGVDHSPAVHEADQSLDEITYEAEAPRLRPIAVDGDLVSADDRRWEGPSGREG